MTESERSFAYMPEGIGGFPQHEGIEERFEIFVNQHKGVPGIEFIRAAVSYVRDQLGYSSSEFIYEMSEALLSCMYPVPDRMLPLSEKIVGHYIRREMIGAHPFNGSFDMYAVEGGTAAMTYLSLIQWERTISALSGWPYRSWDANIYTLHEIPELNDYKLVEVNIETGPETNWQFTKNELDKLRDPKCKAFFLVNPSNPPSVKMSDENLAYLAEIVKERPNILLS